MIAPIFVSHGAPTLIVEDIPARDFLAKLGRNMARPKAVLVVSAHWETREPHASIAERPETIHDFYGFPEELYRLRYDAPGAPEIARRAVDLLTQAGIPATGELRGLDHGAWCPLMLMYPRADIPVTQVSIQPMRGPAHHYAVGQALRALTTEDVLIVASGGAVHNLRAIAGSGDQTIPEWAQAFDDWLAEKIAAGDVENLIDYRARAPGAAAAHPRDEHFLPLFVAMGAAGDRPKGDLLHTSFSRGSLSMAAFRFGSTNH